MLWTAVECGETKKYTLTPRLEGSISSSNGLSINAIIFGDLVKQVLPNIDDVIHMYVSDEHSMEYAVDLSDVAYAADFTLRGNKVQQMFSIIDLTWTSDDDSLLGKAVKTSPDVARDYNTIQTVAKDAKDHIHHSDDKTPSSSTSSGPTTPEA